MTHASAPEPVRSTPLVDVFPKLPECCEGVDFSAGRRVLKELLADVMSEEHFLKHYYKKKALVIPGPPQRFLELINLSLAGLSLESLLEATPTEQVHCWLPTRDAQTTALQSFQVDEPRHAMSVHRAGGSLYFRAPDELSEHLIPSLTAELGMGHGAFYRGTSADDKPNGDIRGEIETFVSRKGHLTDWHFDFMENFTLQLSGTKTWKFKYANAPHPVRGCTPHFAESSVVEQQIKVHRLTKPDFEFAPPPHSVASDGRQDEASSSQAPEEYVEIKLEAGSFMYFPEGIWHRVECAEEGQGPLQGHSCISINLSLFSAPWADTAADAVRQLLLRDDAWRSGMSKLPPNGKAETKLSPKHLYGRAHMQKLLDSLKQKVAALSVDDLFPQFITGQMDSHQFQKYTDMKFSDLEVGGASSTRMFRRNPLSVMFESVAPQFEEIDDEGDESDDDAGSTVYSGSDQPPVSRFTVHFNFGNEEYDSLVRVELWIPQQFRNLATWLSDKADIFPLSASTIKSVPQFADLKQAEVATLLDLLFRSSYLSPVEHS